MGCVYCMWQLVFADIIDNKNWILHWHCRLKLIYTLYDRHLTHVCDVGHPVIDTWPDYTSDSTTDCPYYYLFIFCTLFSVLFHYRLSLHAHMLYARAPSPLFLQIHLEFWLHGFAYTDLWLFMTDQVFREDHRHLEEHWVLFIRLLVFSLSFYFCRFLWFPIYWTHCLLYSFIYLLSCVVISYAYCSVIISL